MAWDNQGQTIFPSKASQTHQPRRRWRRRVQGSGKDGSLGCDMASQDTQVCQNPSTVHLKGGLKKADFRQSKTKKSFPWEDETAPSDPAAPWADQPRGQVQLRERTPAPSLPLTSSGSGWGSWPGLDFFGWEGPAGLEKDFGSLAEDDIRGLTDPEGPPSRCPPPEKGTKGAGVGSVEICFARASTSFGPRPSTRPAPGLAASS